ncbi:MAG: chromophore lyase CpcT/CpeT [Hormoscilla sp. GM7CHS1pb]|nr:chromophore lyase CpcT/CpeT [Hormoscilla sp. GM7CHS1pb]
MRQKSILAGWAIGALTCFHLLTACTQSVPVDRHLDEVATHLVGVMDTSAQAAANSKAPNVKMTTCQVTVHTENGELNSPEEIFLYQEQALQKKLVRPYRQRFLRLTPRKSDTVVESRSFKPPFPADWVGLCNRPEPQRVVSSSEIGNPICSVFLSPEGDRYIGQTQPGGCPTNYRGAVKITNRIILHSEGMDTTDRGFDAQGNQVWGATDSTYQFRWVD